MHERDLLKSIYASFVLKIVSEKIMFILSIHQTNVTHMHKEGFISLKIMKRAIQCFGNNSI